MIRIGKIAAAHGLQGMVVLTHIVGNAKWMKKGTAIFVEMKKGSYIPYFVAAIKTAGAEECIVGLEDVSEPAAAKKLVGKHVYVKEEVVSGYADDTPLLWIGFELTDKTKGAIGPIEDVLQTGKQWLAKITYKEKEALVPLVEGIVTKIDIKNRQITVDLPEGLLEVYL
jgi:16S rRNA processing protein RimM